MFPVQEGAAAGFFKKKHLEDFSAHQGQKNLLKVWINVTTPETDKLL